MDTQLQARSRLFFLAILTLALLSIANPKNLGHTPPLPWQTSFEAFIKEVASIAARTPAPDIKELVKRERDLAVLSDQSGYEIDANPPPGTRQAEITRTFAGKSFDWLIPNFKLDQTPDPANLRQFDFIVGKFIAPKIVEGNLDPNQKRTSTQELKFPETVVFRIYGMPTPPTGETLNVKGTLGRSTRHVGYVSLSGACLLNLTERKDGGYSLYMILNGRWNWPWCPAAEEEESRERQARN